MPITNPGQMRQSCVLEKLRRGEVVLSFKLNLDSARVAELAAASGFDCIWTCMEHTATDWSMVEKQIWAAKTQDVDVLVRVARGCYSDYIRALEMDASGIMVPHVMSLEDARQVVRTTRFHPVGLRPIDGGNADGNYCAIDIQDYIRQSNEQRFVAIQIEDPDPLDDLEAIAALDGIDIIFFGPGDFSQAIGVPGQVQHPRVVETRKRIAEVCETYGKVAGTSGSCDNIQELVQTGYRFINVGADVLGLRSYCADVLSKCTKLIDMRDSLPVSAI